MADKDTDVQNRNKPVPGANDGASGVGLLLDLSRSISNSTELVTAPVWLVFFDLEDNGGFPGWEWIIGSTYFAQSLEIKPAMVVIVDMIGDKDLHLYYEVNSTPEIREEIWKVAEDLGFNDVFIPEEKYRILDDHIPFLERGIPAVDIIDFDYPYWHTTLDTYDKVSPDNIRIVSDVIFQWILRNDQLK
jgi:Zn-dependent M28 family amino/carboxypeptidase